MMNPVEASDYDRTRRFPVCFGVGHPARCAMSRCVGGAALGLFVLGSRLATAQYVTDPSAPVFADAPKPRQLVEIRVDEDSGWSVGLEGYAGLSTLTTSERTKGHALTGGVSRLRFDFFQVGASLEVSDLVDEQWQSLGGFVGGFVPFTNWVDLDASVGISSRNWISKDTRYGAGGTSVRVPSLNLRFGVSDRMTRGLLGPRMGAALLVGFDLDRRNVPWSYQLTRSETVVGTTEFGGVTIALVATLGFDVNKRRKIEAVRSSSD